METYFKYEMDLAIARLEQALHILGFLLEQPPNHLRFQQVHTSERGWKGMECLLVLNTTTG